MLRLMYLAFLYWWYGGNLSTLSEELTAGSSDQGSATASTSPPAPAPSSPSQGNGTSKESSTPAAPSTGSQLQHPSMSPTEAALGNAERGVRSTTEQGQGEFRGGSGDDKLREELELKRAAAVEKVTPLTVLTSIVSDFDVVADWYFFEEGLEGETKLLAKFALAFTVIGTIMYVLLTLEFHPISKVWTWLKGKPLSPLQHVPLGCQLVINVVVEDIPQLVITCIASPDSVAGVLNIATAGFSLMAKVAEGVATRKDLPMSSQLHMIEEDPGVVRHMMVQQHNAEEVAANAARLAVLANKFRQERDSRRQRAFAFQVMQLDPGFLNGSLNYMRDKLEVDELDLSESWLKGSIPSNLGDLTQLTKLDLSYNKLSGPIPSSLGDLTQLTELDLTFNKLSGPIPSKLGDLTQLTELELRDNKLSGSIPPELGGLVALTFLNLSGNQLTGPIPDEFGQLRALRRAYFWGNNFSGTKEGVQRLLPSSCRVYWCSDSD